MTVVIFLHCKHCNSLFAVSPSLVSHVGSLTTMVFFFSIINIATVVGAFR
jgi:hypothetical protein